MQKRTRFILLLVVAFGVLAVWFVVSNRPLETTPAEHALVLGIGELAVWADHQPDPQRERLSKRANGGGVSLVYEYTGPEGSPYLNYTIHRYDDAAQALVAYRPLWRSAELGLGFKTDGFVLEEVNDRFGWGDQSRFAIIRQHDEPVGNLFVAVRDEIVVFCLFTGVYFEEGEHFSALIEPALQRLMTWASSFGPLARAADHRRDAKNSVNRAQHSSASTPPVVSMRWFSVSEPVRLNAVPAAPARGSAAP